MSWEAFLITYLTCGKSQAKGRRQSLHGIWDGMTTWSGISSFVLSVALTGSICAILQPSQQWSLSTSNWWALRGFQVVGGFPVTTGEFWPILTRNQLCQVPHNSRLQLSLTVCCMYNLQNVSLSSVSSWETGIYWRLIVVIECFTITSLFDIFVNMLRLGNK